MEIVGNPKLQPVDSSIARVGMRARPGHVSALISRDKLSA